MKKARIAVLVSGGGTNLQALLDAQKAGNIPHGEIVLVISNVAGAYALQRAAQAGVPARTVRKTGSQQAFEEELLATLTEFQADMIVLAGFLAILSENFTRRYPAFCGKGFYGLKVHQAALDYGVKVTGATVHFVNEIPDGGKILLQKAVDILPTDTAETLQRRVMEQAEWMLLPKAVEMVAEKLTTEDEE